MHSFVEIESLHGYKTHVATDDAISALLREHDRLVAASVSDEVVDGMLDWMKEGWYFGETSSSSSGASTASLTAITASASTATARPPSNGPLEEISDIANEARIRHQREQIMKHQQERQNELNDAEKNVKFALFMLTFMYFRSLYITKVTSIKLSGELVGPKQRKPIPTERLRMIQEEELAQARRERMQDAMSRAKEGEATRMQRKKEEDEHRLVIFCNHYRKHNLENQSALLIQRTLRGHIARKAVIMWRHRKVEIEASDALYNACSTAISRYWRGHKGREEANVLRREMAEFLIAIRSSDLEDEQRERQKRNQ
jgi:hypothetical protein